MMDWPKPLSGLTPFAAWLNRFLGKAKTCTPLESKDFRVEFNSNGFFLRPKFQTGGGIGKTIDANYKVMAITQLGSSLVPPLYDLLVCREWDLTTNNFKNATDVYVAKDMEARRTITSEFYFDDGDNVTQTYVYFVATAADATYGDNFRLASDGTNTELQVMEKRYYNILQMSSNHGSTFQAVLYVVDTGIATGVKDPHGNDVTRIEVKPFRAWIRYETQ